MPAGADHRDGIDTEPRPPFIVCEPDGEPVVTAMPLEVTNGQQRGDRHYLWTNRTADVAGTRCGLAMLVAPWRNLFSSRNKSFMDEASHALVRPMVRVACRRALKN
jgi:hypothetical protein